MYIFSHWDAKICKRDKQCYEGTKRKEPRTRGGNLIYVVLPIVRSGTAATCFVNIVQSLLECFNKEIQYVTLLIGGAYSLKIQYEREFMQKVNFLFFSAKTETIRKVSEFEMVKSRKGVFEWWSEKKEKKT